MASNAHQQDATQIAPCRDAVGSSSRSDVPDLLRLYAVLIPVALSAYLAFAAMLIVDQIPARDNVDDVGLSLMRGYLGYSEAAEQRGFVSLVITSILGGLGFSILLTRLSKGHVLAFGNVLIWILLATLLAYYQRYLPVGKLLLFGFAALAVFRLGRTVIAFRIDREKWAYPGFLSALILWSITFDSGTFVFVRLSTIYLCVAVVSLALLSILQRKAPRRMSSLWPTVTILTCLVLVGTTWSQSNLTKFLIVGVFTLLFIGACSTQIIETIDWRITSYWRYCKQSSRRMWLVGFLFSIGLIETGFTLNQAAPELFDVILLALQGVSLGFLLYLGGVEPKFRLLRFKVSWHEQLGNKTWLLPVAVMLVAGSRGWNSIWLGLCVAAAAVLIIQSERYRLRRLASTGPVLAVILAMAFLPEFVNTRGFDRFHDGQVLSGIWEFEQGEPLYSRVLPLRSTQFFVGWLSRRLFVPTSDGTFLFEKFADAACAAGACLVAFAWCRSPLWSFVIALLVQPGGEIAARTVYDAMPFISAMTGLQVPSFGDPRDGALLLISGIACEVLRRNNSQLWLVLLGIPAFLCGYDIMAAYLGGIAIAMFCGQLGPGTNFPSLLKSVVASTKLVLITMAVFTGLLVVLQGFESAYAFWQVFFDYCRHFSSFCGTPLQRNRFIDIELLGLVIFAANGVVCWKQRGRRRREMWGYLLACSSLFWFRALGRSDYGHVTGPLHMLHLVWCLNALDIMTIIKRCRILSIPQWKPIIGATLLVILVFTAGPTSNPWRFFQQCSNACSAKEEDLTPSQELERLVAPDEYLWAVDDGIANYIQHRHNPTRHGQAICISSPNEQRVAVQDLQRHPPKVIIWDWTPHDDIHGLTRQYILGNFVLRNFRPGGKVELLGRQPAYAVPTDPFSPGIESIPDNFNSPQELQHLPRIWGELRWPQLTQRVNSQISLKEWNPVSNGRPQQTANCTWSLDVDLIPRQFNYLRFEFAVEPGSTRNQRNNFDRKWTTVSLQFNAAGRSEDFSETSWTCPMDGERHSYLVPIGCHPGWTWRTAIRQIQLHGGDDIIQNRIELDALDIDEISAR